LKCVSFTTDKQAWTETADHNLDLKTTLKEFITEKEKKTQDSINSVYNEIMLSVNQLQEEMKKNNESKIMLTVNEL
jgi:gas vesicle protein